MSESINLLKMGRRNIKDYAIHVLTQRAIADLRDNLKPVQRRILWSMYKEGLRNSGPTQVAQKVISNVAGDFHPHSSDAIFGALANMVGSDNFPHPLVYGKGNWVSHSKPPGAPRYVSCKLSKLAEEEILDPDYMAVIQYEDNYNGEMKEPVYLPCKLPLILLSGNSGIAVGSSAGHPPLSVSCVKKYIKQWFKYGEAKPSYKNVEFNWYWGSNCVAEETRIKQWIRTGSGALAFEPNYTIDDNKYSLMITDVPPTFNWKSVVNTLSGGSGKKPNKKFDCVKTITDLTDSRTPERKVRIKIEFKRSEDFRDDCRKVIDVFTKSFTTFSNITLRNTSEDVDFKLYPLKELINQWMLYRIDLEVRMQKHKIQTLKGLIANQDLLILVTNNLDLVINTIRHSMKPKEDLMKKLELTQEQAEYILELQLRRISKLDQEKVKKTRAELVKKKKQAALHRDNPNPKVQDDLIRGFALLEKA
jgi:DNA gyrase subunit A